MSVVDKRKEFVVDTAKHIFLKNGIAGVTMAEIADECQYGVASLYRYFTNKQTLVVECAVKMWEERIVRIEEVHEENKKLSGFEQMRALAKFYPWLVISDEAFSRFLYYFDAYLINEIIEPDVRKKYDEVMLRLYDIFEAVYKVGLADGTIREVGNFADYYFANTQSLLGFAQKLKVRGNIVSSDKTSADKINIIIDLLTEYLKKEKEYFVDKFDEKETANMDEFRILEIKESVFADNDKQANNLREQLKKDNTFLLNLMSSPGSGKTTTLMRTIAALRDDLKIAVMEADIDSDVDAKTIQRSGAKVIQLHTGGMCHLTADMTRQGLEGMGTEGIDLAILENVGNLVCPAEFDTGAVKNAMILSVPEGDDKPLKYPLMFSICDVLLINKIDAMDYFNFDIKACSERAKKLNPNIQIIPISAKTGEGIAEWAEWLKKQVKEWQNG